MKTLESTTLAVLLLLAGSTLVLPGCAVVKPWERDVLARPDMAWDPDAQQAALRNHINFSKEGSLPAAGGGGGGCGCN